MGNYTYSEIHDMQQKAMERVNEMKKKTDELIYHQDTSPQKKQYESHLYETKITSMDANLPKEKQYDDFKSYIQNNDKPHNLNINNNILNDILKEPDKLLLFGIILLLQSENVDNELLMAILYIML